LPSALAGGTPGSSLSTQSLNAASTGADLSWRIFSTVSSGSVPPAPSRSSRSSLICRSTAYTLPM